MKFMSIFSRAKSIAAITAVSIGLTICFFVIDIPILHIFELKLYDLRVQKRGLQQPAPVVALAMIDEKSLDREGRWPWPALENRNADRTAFRRWGKSHRLRYWFSGTGRQGTVGDSWGRDSWGRG
jgi:hypothetical protein